MDTVDPKLRAGLYEGQRMEVSVVLQQCDSDTLAQTQANNTKCIQYCLMTTTGSRLFVKSLDLCYELPFSDKIFVYSRCFCEQPL